MPSPFVEVGERPHVRHTTGGSSLHPHLEIAADFATQRRLCRTWGSLCRRGDLNPHALAGTSPSSWRVCLFRHSDVGWSLYRSIFTGSVSVRGLGLQAGL